LLHFSPPFYWGSLTFNPFGLGITTDEATWLFKTPKEFTVHDLSNVRGKGNVEKNQPGTGCMLKCTYPNHNYQKTLVFYHS